MEQQNDQLQQENQDAEDLAQELEFLKETARSLGIKFSNNISPETLSEKISQHQAELARKEEEAQQASIVELVPGTGAYDAALRRAVQAKALKLVRVRINNLDPKKNELKGEIITVGNDYVGTIRKFVPFGKATDNGYHIPMIMFNYLKNKEYLVVRSVVHPQTKQISTEMTYEREFALEVLPPLEKDEIKQLAAKQLAANSVE